MTSSPVSFKLGIVGGGVMAEAILSRLVSQSIYRSDQICVSDISEDRLTFLQEKYNVHVSTDNAVVAGSAQVLLLAIKPQVFQLVAASLRPACSESLLIISILAGVDLGQLESIFDQQPVVRSMPNTPAMVGSGITAIAGGTRADSQHLQLAQSLFNSVGEVVTVSESLMDAVTGLSGSGPAFVAIAIEAMTDGGVAAGLPRAVAAQLALQTVRGTAELLHQSEIHPAVLKDRVTSPGGTTIAGVAELEQSGLRSAMIQAVLAAYQRSQELGERG